MLRAGRAFQELNSSEKRLAKTQELAMLGNWEFDLVDNSFHCSPEASRLQAMDPDEQVTYDAFLSPIVPKEYNQIKDEIDEAIKSRTSFRINYRVILFDGTIRHILNRGEILLGKNGIPEIILGAVQDVSQLKEAEEEIRRLAFYDDLTGLANRMLFMGHLAHEISLAERNDKNFALLFLDLDEFKRINDTHGHHVGDLLLKNVSNILQQCTRSSDSVTGPVDPDADGMVARLGGDEFIILLADINEPGSAAVVARKILHEMAKPQTLDMHDISVTTSIGISVFPSDGNTAEVLMKHADSAMYHAKKTGRNNYQFYRGAINAEVEERFSFEQDLKGALERDEFLLYYQPQIDLLTHKIIGAEALIRWDHPQKGMLLPETFISIAEGSGLIVDINKWVIETACRQNQIWRHSGLNSIKTAVNLSGHQLAKQNIIQIIRDALQENDFEAKYLEIEITENVLMQDDEDTAWILQQIKDLNVKIALDDFGTGYSSLSQLASFPVDVVKIDHTFVMSCTKHKENIAIIKAIVAMGHSLGMKVIAEGVE
ncbi:MAG: EAL domain-containing protein, partial [Desulfocapsa sp.]|nr:EAL domain-containing protein [Desulfocapsa sp.]